MASAAVAAAGAAWRTARYVGTHHVTTTLVITAIAYVRRAHAAAAAAGPNAVHMNF
jgi:hypothetical protein